MTPKMTDEPAYWTPKRIAQAVLLSAVLVGALAAGVMASPHLQPGSESSCEEIAEDHFRQALEATPGSEAHFWAGVAAQELQANGHDCQEA